MELTNIEMPPGEGKKESLTALDVVDDKLCAVSSNGIIYIWKLLKTQKNVEYVNRIILPGKINATCLAVCGEALLCGGTSWHNHNREAILFVVNPHNYTVLQTIPGIGYDISKLYTTPTNRVYALNDDGNKIYEGAIYS